MGGDSIGHWKKEVTEIQLFESPELTPIYKYIYIYIYIYIYTCIVPWNEKLGLQKKDGYTRRIVGSLFGCCCLHKET